MKRSYVEKVVALVFLLPYLMQ